MKTQQLTAKDRCDRCPAQAYVRTVLSEGGLELLWCAHHWAEHGEALRQLDGAQVQDETSRLKA